MMFANGRIKKKDTIQGPKKPAAKVRLYVPAAQRSVHDMRSYRAGVW